MDFESRYKQLNDNQRQAVDTIDGPIMVIAGPGTGKTELLAMRAANILKQTDALPENILCLTFTDAGSIAMKKRLTSIIGRDAYKVSVFTFHSFGSEIMSRYREYFYQGASFQLADDLARHQIVTEILDSLDYDDPLRSRMNGVYTSVKDILTAISDLKRAGLTDAEFGLLLESVQATTEIVDKLLSDIISARVVKGTRDALDNVLPQIEAIDEELPVLGITSLKDVLASSIRHAIEAADQHEKVTPPLSSWKSEWTTTDNDKKRILKVQKDLPKLRRLMVVYGLYLQRMQEAGLYDYDDMIMQIVHAMELNNDLRYDLQEKYQYIMVDEFQDTNMAQMRILHNLTNNPVVEDTPNILVVGDDDQAIYGFQGAEVGNILSFRNTYPRTANIALTDNYRSVQAVLDGARAVITQGVERLENHLPELDKTLVSVKESAKSSQEIINFASPYDERGWVALTIRDLIDSGVKPNEIAIIARKHDDLVSLISFLTDKNIPISYSRQDDVLDDESILQLEHISKIVRAISDGNYTEVNALLPQLLSHPAWGIEPITVWDISISAHKSHEHWLEIMQKTDVTKAIFNWLIAAAGQSKHLPLERILDILIGNAPLDGYTSPFKDFFFSDKARNDDLSSYSAHLKNLSAIRAKLREHTFGSKTPKLADFLDYMAQNRLTNTRISSIRHIGEDGESVQLISAHGSKGLEFEHVFIVNATDSMWGEKARGKASAITFPPHLRLRQNSNNYDERLRLFYVAMTRARHGLHISYANENDNAKEMLRASFLLDGPLLEHSGLVEVARTSELQAAEYKWYAPIVNIPQITMDEYLKPTLGSYMLSATHINSFLDVTSGGPQHFLLNTLLRFPSARSPAASYGSAIHATLQRAHDHVKSTGSLQPEEDILQEFEKQIKRLEFTDAERHDFIQRGSDVLRAFLREHHSDFTPNQYAELDFSRQDVHIAEAHITGKLDVVEFDKDAKTAKVIDYKTGHSLNSWDKGPDYQKIKAHKYRQQLLFYKLLIENSRDWHAYTMKEGILQFVEPDNSGHIVNLALNEIPKEELERFKVLIGAIWKHINDLSFPDTSAYEQTLKGIIQFEEDLLAGQ